jgi:hydroxymethylglutaryl-CoA synthase
LGLAAILDIATPGQTIFMASYGSGAGSDAFLWKVTEKITALQHARSQKKQRVADHIAHKMYVDYVGYLKQTHKI